MSIRTHRVRATGGLLVLGLWLFGAAGCSPPEPAATAATGSDDAASESTDIHDKVWQWSSVTRKTTSEVTTVPDPTSYSITFRHDGSLTGQADCNSFAGTYTQESGFEITLGAVTEAYCGEDSLDARYLELLANIAAGGPDGAGGLALETAGGEERMLFASGGPAPAE